jgi:hypothetical protein
MGTNKVGILLAWAVTLAAAFAVGRSTPPAGSDSVRVKAHENLAAAIEAALGEPDVLDRAERTGRLLQGLGPENVTEVVGVYDRMLNILGELAIRPFVAAWARFDPEAALQHTLSWRFQDKRELGASAAIEAWALHDPTGALEAYERVIERYPRLGDVLFSDMLTGWVYSGQGGVDEYIAKLPMGSLDSAITRVAAKTLRGGGLDAMLDWANSILSADAYETKFKKKVFQRGSRMAARWDPERAAAWVVENRGQSYAYDGPRIVAEQWGRKDGRAALEWTRNLADKEQRHQAAREAFLQWLDTDRAGAVEWLESEEITAFHDPVIVLYTKELVRRAPAEAVGWCERIVDEQRQLGCLKKTAPQWYRRDAVAAETWLQQSPLDDEGRREVRTPAKKAQR